MTYNRAVRNSTKSTRIKLARWIQKNLKNINWYSCYESSNAGKCHTFLVSFIIPLDGLNDLGLTLLCGARYFQRFLNEPHEQRSHLTQHLFSKAGLRKLFSLKNNLCPGLVLCHLTAKIPEIFLWLPLQVIFSIWYFQPQLKTKIWNYIILVPISLKDPVSKQFFIASGLEICIHLRIIVNSSLVRAITRVPG